MSWDTMTVTQRLRYLGNVAGQTSEKITLDLTHVCETRLNDKQRKRYVDFISAEISAMTYAQNDPYLEDTVDVYYFNMLHLLPEIRARMIWHAVENVAP